MRDTGLSACAKAVEHCEMAHYGTLDVWAGALNMNNATLLLREPLAEQKDT